MAKQGNGRQCYAAPLGGCSAGLTHEHYISSGVLQELEKFGPIKVSGASWAAQPKLVSSSTTKARILCSHHNEGLSELDAEALRLFKWLSTIPIDGNPMSDRISLNGYLFERWLLKVLCGLLASGTLKHADIRMIGVPSVGWLNVLFGHVAMSSRCGLYMWEGFQECEYQHAIRVRYVYSEPATGSFVLKGAEFTLQSIRWLLAMQDPAAWGESSAGWRCYRPASLNLHGDDGISRTLGLDW